MAAPIEVAAKKKVTSVETLAGKLQTGARDAISALTEAVLELQGTVTDLEGEIEAKQEELQEMAEEGVVLGDIQALNIKLEDKKAAQKRSLAALAVEMADAKAKLQKEIDEEKKRVAEAKEDLAREERFASEDEARAHAQTIADERAELDGRWEKVTEAEDLVASFDSNVDGKVKKQVGIIKGAMDAKAKQEKTESDARFTVLQGELSASRARTAELESRCDSLQDKLSESQDKLAELATAQMVNSAAAAEAAAVKNVIETQAGGTKRK